MLAFHYLEHRSLTGVKHHELLAEGDFRAGLHKQLEEVQLAGVHPLVNLDHLIVLEVHTGQKGCRQRSSSRAWLR